MAWCPAPELEGTDTGGSGETGTDTLVKTVTGKIVDVATSIRGEVSTHTPCSALSG